MRNRIVVLQLLSCIAATIFVGVNAGPPPAVVKQLLMTLLGRTPYATSEAEYQRLTQSPVTQMHLKKASFGAEFPSTFTKPYEESARSQIAELDRDIERIRDEKNAIKDKVKEVTKDQGAPLLKTLMDPKKSGDLGVGSDVQERALMLEEKTQGLNPLASKQFYKAVSARYPLKKYLLSVPSLKRYNRAYKTIEANTSHFENLKEQEPEYTPSESLQVQGIKQKLKLEMNKQMQPIMPERGDVAF